jgi:hypothetical protein
MPEERQDDAREPAQETPPPPEQPQPPPPLPNALLMQVELPKCKRCGGTKFHKCNATRPNLSATQMTRRKQCYQCGQWWVMQSDPTPEERARYWPKVSGWSTAAQATLAAAIR